MGIATEVSHRFLAGLSASAVAASVLAGVTAQAAVAQTFSNTNPLAPPNTAPASTAVVSSTISVSGLSALTDINVTLHSFSADGPGDFDILLEGPDGKRIMLMSDEPNQYQPGGPSPCEDDVSNLTLTFDDAAPAVIPNNVAMASGTYRPSDDDGDDCDYFNDSNLIPANTVTSLSAFNGTDPNGTWRLYVADDFAGQGLGSISGGRSLDLSTGPTSTPAPTPAPSEPPTTCAGLAATITGAEASKSIVGTPGNDVLVGTPGNDVISGFGGDDIIRGLGGNDIICGGDGHDKLKGGAGADWLYGEAGRDKLKGGTSPDYCNGGLDKDKASKCEKATQI